MPHSCMGNSNVLFAISLGMARTIWGYVCWRMLLLGLGNLSKRNVPIIKIPGEMDIKFIQTNKLKQSSRGIYSLGTAGGVQKLKEIPSWSCVFFCFSWIGTKQLLHHMPIGLARSKPAWPLPIQWIPDQEQAWARQGGWRGMHASNHASTGKALKKAWKHPFPEALKLSNNGRKHIEWSLMLVQEIYGEGMVVVKHGGISDSRIARANNFSSPFRCCWRERIEDKKGYENS